MVEKQIKVNILFKCIKITLREITLGLKILSELCKSSIGYVLFLTYNLRTFKTQTQLDFNIIDVSSQNVWECYMYT